MVSTIDVKPSSFGRSMASDAGATNMMAKTTARIARSTFI